MMYAAEALENLMKAVHSTDPKAIQTALDFAKETLGYDPINPDRGFEVSLRIDFFTSSAEEAVKEFIALTGVGATEWVYAVKDDNGEETNIDSYNMSSYAI